MRLLLSVIVPFVLFSCVDSEEFDIPVNEISGQYSYESSSNYYNDDNLTVERSVNSIGSLEINSFQNNIRMSPLAGWAYNVAITNREEHVLTNGEIATTYSVLLQEQFVTSVLFKFQGTGNTVLWDSDGANLGTYDGVVYGGDSLRFEIRSFNGSTFEQTVTEIVGERR